MQKRGFTLIELLVVIAIIGILATLVFTQLGAAQVRARNSSAKSDITEISKGIAVYLTNNGIDNYLDSNPGAGTPVVPGTRINGTTPQGVWTTLFGTSTTDGTYNKLRIAKTPGTGYTYGYVTSVTAGAGYTAGTSTLSSDYCLATNVVNSNGVNDGAFYANTGTTGSYPNGTAAPTYGAGVCN